MQGPCPPDIRFLRRATCTGRAVPAASCPSSVPASRARSGKPGPFTLNENRLLQHRFVGVRRTTSCTAKRFCSKKAGRETTTACCYRPSTILPITSPPPRISPGRTASPTTTRPRSVSSLPPKRCPMTGRRIAAIARAPTPTTYSINRSSPRRPSSPITWKSILLGHWRFRSLASCNRAWTSLRFSILDFSGSGNGPTRRLDQRPDLVPGVSPYCAHPKGRNAGSTLRIRCAGSLHIRRPEEQQSVWSRLDHRQHRAVEAFPDNGTPEASSSAGRYSICRITRTCTRRRQRLDRPRRSVSPRRRLRQDWVPWPRP